MNAFQSGSYQIYITGWLAGPIRGGRTSGGSWVHLWAQSVEEAGRNNVSAVREALCHQKFEAPGGPVRIDPENQHTWKTMRLGRIVEGGFEFVWSSENRIKAELDR
jgi:hypothetical protein